MNVERANFHNSFAPASLRLPQSLAVAAKFHCNAENSQRHDFKEA
jgi:hypothetical protein